MDERSRTLRLLRDARIEAISESKRVQSRLLSDGGGSRVRNGTSSRGVSESAAGGGGTLMNSQSSWMTHDVKGSSVAAVTRDVAAAYIVDAAVVVPSPVLLLSASGSGGGAEQYGMDGDLPMMPLPDTLASVLREDERLRNIRTAAVNERIAMEQEAKARRVQQQKEWRGKRSADIKSAVRCCGHVRLLSVRGLAERTSRVVLCRRPSIQMQRQHNARRYAQTYLLQAEIDAADARDHEWTNLLPSVAVQEAISRECVKLLHAPEMVCGVCDEFIRIGDVSDTKIVTRRELPAGAIELLSRDRANWSDELKRQYEAHPTV